MRNIVLTCLTFVVMIAGVSAQPAVKTKAQADKWRTYAKIQVENATNELPVMAAYRDNLIADLSKLTTEFNTRKGKMEPADVTVCTNQLARGNAKVTLTTSTLGKAQKELGKASTLFNASSNAYALGLWGVAANKAVESDIEGGNSNRHIERAGEIVDVGYEHWAIAEKVLAKYRMGMEEDK